MGRPLGITYNGLSNPEADTAGERGKIVRNRGRTFLMVVGFLLCLCPAASKAALADTGQETPAKTPLEVMREAVKQALNLRFDPAYQAIEQVQADDEESLEALLTRGIIAYLRTHWQTRQRPPAHVTARKLFAAIVERGERRLRDKPHQGRLQLLAGLAAVFGALLPDPETPWEPLQMAAQGRTRLEQALMSGEDLNDAHLGLGMLYFIGEGLPALGRRLLGEDSLLGSEEAARHLRLASESAQFSRDLARTFLLQLYFTEQRYGDAVPLGESLRQAYPGNGYMALLTGLSQYESGDEVKAAETLGDLAATLSERPEALAKAGDRFELYYTWGQALLDADQDDQAFGAFREAINNDPGASRDETLWAKFHLAALYDKRGLDETARQMFCTLLRGRGVDDLHRQAEHRLGSRRCG